MGTTKKWHHCLFSLLLFCLSVFVIFPFSITIPGVLPAEPLPPELSLELSMQQPSDPKSIADILPTVLGVSYDYVFLKILQQT